MYKINYANNQIGGNKNIINIIKNCNDTNIKILILGRSVSDYNKYTTEGTPTDLVQKLNININHLIDIYLISSLERKLISNYGSNIRLIDIIGDINNEEDLKPMPDFDYILVDYSTMKFNLFSGILYLIKNRLKSNGKIILQDFIIEKCKTHIISDFFEFDEYEKILKKINDDKKKFEIYIILPNNEKKKLDISNNLTIQELRILVCAKLGTPSMDLMRYAIYTSKLKKKLLIDEKHKNLLTQYISCSQSDEMYYKKIIQISIMENKISFAGRLLSNDNTLSSYPIQKDSTISYVITLGCSTSIRKDFLQKNNILFEKYNDDYPLYHYINGNKGKDKWILTNKKN